MSAQRYAPPIVAHTQRPIDPSWYDDEPVYKTPAPSPACDSSDTDICSSADDVSTVIDCDDVAVAGEVSDDDTIPLPSAPSTPGTWADLADELSYWESPLKELPQYLANTPIRHEDVVDE